MERSAIWLHLEILFIWGRKKVKRYKYLSLETFENKFLICHLRQISVHSNLSLGIKTNFACFTNSTLREFSYKQMLICHTFENRAILNFSNINQPEVKHFHFFALPISSWYRLKWTAFFFSLSTDCNYFAWSLYFLNFRWKHGNFSIFFTLQKL